MSELLLLFPIETNGGSSPPAPSAPSLLLETSDHLQLESADFLLLE